VVEFLVPPVPPPRQWLVFPHARPRIRSARLAAFQALLEDELGFIGLLEIRARTPPDPQETAETLAAHGWGARTPWRPLSRKSGAPVLRMLDDVESSASWPIHASVQDALGAALAAQSPPSASEALRLRDDLHQAFCVRLESDLRAFVDGLDPQIVDLARAAGGLSAARYNFLAGGDPIVRRNRVQAVSRHPILLDSLATDPAYEAVRKAIDLGEPLLDRLVLHLGAPKSVLRRVADTPLAWIDAQWRARPHLLMRLLADIEPSKRPATRDEWSRFDRAVSLVARTTGHPPTSTSNRLWLRRTASDGFRETGAPDAPGADVAAAAAILDAFAGGLQAALDEDLRDLVGARQAEPLARHALVQLQQGLGVNRLAALATKWLAAWRAEQAAAEAELELASGERWPSLLPEGAETRWAEAEGLRVVALCTPADLREEAARMSHCVDTYVAACARGECQIYSLRSPSGASLSTLETKLSRTLAGAFSIVAVQHAGAFNAKPSARCVRVAGELVRLLAGARDRLDDYWRWRANVRRLARGDRLAVARAAASRRALERVLPGRFAYQALLRSAMAAGTPGDSDPPRA